MLMDLDDPNIVKCYHAGESDRFVYLALEFLPGGNLQELLDKRTTLTVPQAVGVTRRVLEGLGAVHRHGIYHRDLKPSNVLLDGQSRPKLADFGLARSAMNSRITSTGEVLGTVDYMAPEQFESVKKIDGRADLYSVGAMLYHLVTGKPPYKGRSSFAVLEQHRDAPCPDPAAEVPEAKQLTSVIKRLMAKAPDKRPKDAAAALSLLSGFSEEPLVPGGFSGGDVSRSGRPSLLLDGLLVMATLPALLFTADAVRRVQGHDLLAGVPWAETFRSLGTTYGLEWCGALGLLALDRAVARLSSRGIFARLFGQGRR
jgi:eukaryotic-like serine/threonine-protein kinase